MSAYTQYLNDQKTFNDSVDKALTDISTLISQQNALIKQLQNSPGQVTSDDQALIDQLEANGANLVQKANALDTLNPPTPPANPA